MIKYFGYVNSTDKEGYLSYEYMVCQLEDVLDVLTFKLKHKYDILKEINLPSFLTTVSKYFVSDSQQTFREFRIDTINGIEALHILKSFIQIYDEENDIYGQMSKFWEDKTHLPIIAFVQEEAIFKQYHQTGSCWFSPEGEIGICPKLKDMGR